MKKKAFNTLHNGTSSEIQKKRMAFVQIAMRTMETKNKMRASVLKQILIAMSVSFCIKMTITKGRILAAHAMC